MALQAHIRELSEKHARLDVKIQEAIRSPSSEDSQIMALKRQKLKLKEELELLKSRH